MAVTLLAGAILLVVRRRRAERPLRRAVALTVDAFGVGLANARLQAELRARLQDLQESRRRVLEAGRRERQRMERDLHDGAARADVEVRTDGEALVARPRDPGSPPGRPADGAA